MTRYFLPTPKRTNASTSGKSMKGQEPTVSQRAKREAIGTGQAALNLSPYPTGERLLPALPDRLFERLKQGIISPIASAIEYLMIGIGLGVVGAAVLLCAIPILCCISHLPQ